MMKALLMTCVMAMATPGAKPDGADRIRLLEAENRALRAQIESLRAQIEQLTKARMQPAEATTQRTSVPAEGVLYREQVRTEAWLDAIYAELGAHVVALGAGKYRDAGREFAEQPLVWSVPPEVGAVRWLDRPAPKISARTVGVLQADQGGGGLVSLSVPTLPTGRATGFIIHVRGLAANTIDGARPADVPMRYVGPHSYVDTTGARRTVQGYEVLRPLARAEFARALAGGLIVSRYVAKTRKVKEHRLIQSGFNAQTSDVWVTKVEYVEQPIP